MANIGCAAFGCLPATGALARTAANIRAGGRTPVSGMVHAIVVLGIILAAAPLAEYIPLPTLSAVLVRGWLRACMRVLAGGRAGRLWKHKCLPYAHTGVHRRVPTTALGAQRVGEARWAWQPAHA